MTLGKDQIKPKPPTAYCEIPEDIGVSIMKERGREREATVLCDSCGGFHMGGTNLFVSTLRLGRASTLHLSDNHNYRKVGIFLEQP